MDDPTAWLAYVQPKREKYFDPLCGMLRLDVTGGGPHAAYGFVSAVAGFVRVHFEHDRGLCYFAIGPSSEVEALCSVDGIASRFPRVRATSGGVQRLSLSEQASFIEVRWGDLQIMFSPEHLKETRRWREVAGAAFVRKLRGGS